MEPVGAMLLDPKTGRRATVDVYGRVQWWEVDGAGALVPNALDQAPQPREMQQEIDRLRAAIQQTLDENGHLADGDNCTLILLKRAMEKK